MKQKIILFLFLLSALAARAYDAQIDGIYYNFDKSAKTATVTYKNSRYESYAGTVDIPVSVDYNGVTYSVTKIAENAFYRCAYLTSVTIPGSVTTIGNSAFRGCSSLTEVTIPNSVTVLP